MTTMTRVLRTAVRDPKLVGAVALAVAKQPAAAKSLPRLARTAGERTVTVELPWLPFALIDELGHVVTGSSRVFEFGGGGSTLWFAKRAESLTTVEHDASWVELLRAQVATSSNVDLRVASADAGFAEYVESIDAFEDDYFDVVVVDGRERVRCFEHAVPKVKPGGLLIIDDINRSRYASVFTTVSWPREVYRDLAPCKRHLAVTAVFTRPPT